MEEKAVKKWLEANAEREEEMREEKRRRPCCHEPVNWKYKVKKVAAIVQHQTGSSVVVGGSGGERVGGGHGEQAPLPTMTGNVRRKKVEKKASEGEKKEVPDEGCYPGIKEASPEGTFSRAG